jgi:hypothetical protein
MSGGIAPLGKPEDEAPRGFGGKRTRVRPRVGYALALLWVVVGLVLFLIEIVGLVLGRG